VDKMRTFAAETLIEIANAKDAIEKLIVKHTEGEKKKTIMFSKQPPKSILPTVPKDRLQLPDMHPQEIARQMTLMEYDLFSHIKPWEYLSWNTKQKQTKSANILAMINMFNMMNWWVQKEVINSGDLPKQRAATMGKFLEICECLLELQNYNGFMEILSGLNSSAVFRLKLSWECLPSRQIELFQKLNKFTDNNFKTLRQAYHSLEPPCIPYLGMYLTDLTFINDGIPLYLQDSGLINFDKCRKVSGSVQELMQYQQTPYCLTPVEEIQAYLVKQIRYFEEAEHIDREFYNLSLQLEPKQ